MALTDLNKIWIELRRLGKLIASAPSGNYLSVVATDTSLTGNGTSGSPLSGATTLEKIWNYSTQTLTVAGWSTNTQSITLSSTVATNTNWHANGFDNNILAGTSNVVLDTVDVTTDTVFNFKCVNTPTEDIVITLHYQL